MKRRTIFFLVCGACLTGLWLLTRQNRNAPISATRDDQTNITTTPEHRTNVAGNDRVPRVVEVLDAPRLLIARQKAAQKANGPVNFYAAVVDQNGAPVAGAILSGAVSSFNEGFWLNEADAVNKSQFQVPSDAAGHFEIKRDKGVWLYINNLEKHDYFWQHPGFGSFGVGRKAPTRIPSYSTPQQRLILHLWKKGITQPTLRQGARVRLRAEQQVYALNLLTGQNVATNEHPDLIIRFTLVSDPTSAARAHRTVSFEFPNGGILETPDVYPYSAPPTGYEPGWSWIYRAADTPPGQDNWKRNFYARLRNGRMSAGLQVKFDSMPALEIDVTINPTGSPVLEPDPEKQITDPEEIRRLDEATRP